MSADVKTDKAEYSAGEEINIEFSVTGVPTSSDWIGIFKKEAKDTNYITYIYNKNEAMSGSGVIKAPAKAGIYNIRYFDGSDSNNKGISTDFTIK